VLVAFSNGTSHNGPVPASKIFDDLRSEGFWYLPRGSRYLVPNESTVVFYQSGAGVRGHARVVSVEDASEAEQSSVRTRFGLPQIAIKLGLDHVEVFRSPVPIGPLVNDLQFVRNKKYWGHSVRTSPRTINDHDFSVLKAAARKQPSA
jgi:hypothetical protein